MSWKLPCKIRFYRSLLLFTYLFVFFFSATGLASGPDRFSQDQTLIIGGNKDFAPYEYINSQGDPVGYNIDLIRAVALKEGLQIKIVLDTWHKTRRNLEDKKIDAVTGMIYSKQRDVKFDFSLPHMVIPYALFKRKETPLHSRDDVKEKEIIVVEGVYAHDWLLEKQFTDYIITTNSPASALRLLASGNHDFVFMPRLHGLDLIENLNIESVEVAGPPILVNNISFAVIEGNSGLLAELNEGIVSLQQSGEYGDIYLKWFSVSKYQKYMSKVFRYLFIILSVVILIVFTFACWNWLLKRAVRRRTLELRRNQDRLGQIVENIPIPTYVVDEKRVVTHWNRACVLLTGEPVERIVGTQNYHKALFDGQEYSIVDLLLNNSLTSRIDLYDNKTYRESSILAGAYETENFFANLGIDGRWLYGTAALLKDETGKTKGAIETWQDLTESKQLERQLIQSQKMEAIGTLAGGIAHDFNNILTVINSNSQMGLHVAAQDSELKRFFQQIHSAGMQAKKLVQQILTFSRKAEVEAEPVQVSSIIEETLSLVLSSLPSNIEVQQDIQSDAFVMADATHVHQIVLNLFTNAVHAMASGGTLVVCLNEVEFSEPRSMPTGELGFGRFLKMTVSDTGQGIPQQVRDKILEPFFTTKKRGEGTGMGLSVTLGIVKQYGGEIEVESEVGHGATFNVYLPILSGDASLMNDGPEF